MADDADPGRSSAGAGRERADRAPALDRQATHARTDRQSGGRSVETTPESLYLWRIAVLETRVDTLQERVELKERDLQRVVDRYEGLLQGDPAARDGELRTDGGNSVERDEKPDRTATSGSDSAARRALARLRSLVE